MIPQMILNNYIRSDHSIEVFMIDIEGAYYALVASVKDGQVVIFDSIVNLYNYLNGDSSVRRAHMAPEAYDDAWDREYDSKEEFMNAFFNFS
jgi:hypothetical protein